MYEDRLTEATGLKYDSSLKILYGNYKGYETICYTGMTPYRIQFAVSDGGVLNRQMFKDLDRKLVRLVSCEGFRLTVTSQSAFKSDKLIDNLVKALDYMADHLSRKGCYNCSEMDGEAKTTGIYCVGGALRILSREDYAKYAKNTRELAEQDEMTSENVPLGIVGAVVGSLIGVAVIMLLDRIGFVAAIGGTVMSYCAVFGYRKMAGKLSAKSRWIILAIIVLMVLVANHLCWAVTLYDALKDRYIITFGETLRSTGELLSINELWLRYFANLGLIMLFTLLGAIPMLNSSVNSVLNSKTAYVIEEAAEEAGDRHER